MPNPDTLRRILAASHVTREGFAADLGISRRALQHWLAGKPMAKGRAAWLDRLCFYHRDPDGSALIRLHPPTTAKEK